MDTAILSSSEMYALPNDFGKFAPLVYCLETCIMGIKCVSVLSEILFAGFSLW
jgi:hypothetical protein